MSNTTPSNGVGVNGDFAFRLSDGESFQKQNGAWTDLAVSILASALLKNQPVPLLTFTVATLPQQCIESQMVYVSDARKPNELPGAGTGEPAVCTRSWMGSKPVWMAMMGGSLQN